MDLSKLENEDVNSIPDVAKEKPAKKGLNISGIKKIFSKISTEDLILFGILFLLLEEGVEDEFLIFIIVFLILTGSD